MKLIAIITITLSIYKYKGKCVKKILLYLVQIFNQIYQIFLINFFFIFWDGGVKYYEGLVSL
jgi:hypothetical protein